MSNFPCVYNICKDYIGFIGDLSQAGFHKLGKITPEVDSLVEHLRDALDDVGPNGKVIHIAHSQGAIVSCRQWPLLFV